MKKIPARLKPLMEYGVIDRVVRPLLSGKEAQVFLVERKGELCAAKVYKGLDERSFRNRSSYTEERKVRNSRDRRAMAKRSRYGRQMDEQVWSSAEVDTIQTLWKAGVRRATTHTFVDGVLVMECVMGPDGGPAPRLADCVFPKKEAARIFDEVMRQVVGMMCADVVHADLSVYNILLDDKGPVIIDFPQSISASKNAHARQILLRDVANIASRFALGRDASQLRFGYEIWELYETGQLHPEVRLTGKFDLPTHEVDTDRLLEELLQMEEDLVMDEEGEYDEFS